MNSSSANHAARYQGKNLLWLLLAICGPAAILYLRIVFTFAASRTGVGAVESAWLYRAGLLMLWFFFIAQAAGAWHMRTLLPPRKQLWAQILQVAAVFVLGLFFSITGAIMLEAFGYSLFIHLKS